MNRRILVSAVLFVAMTAAGRSDVRDTARHFALLESEPADSSVVAAPTAIKLWFTEAPEIGTTSIRLVGEGAESVHVEEAVQDASDPTLFSVAIHGALPSGPYSVAWRALGEDGHVVRDSFTFTVAAH